MITFDSFHQPRTEKQREEYEQREQYRQARLQAMRERQDEEAVQEAFAREEKQLQKEREEKNIPKKVTLKNPRWEHIDENARLERPNSVYIGETIRLIIDQENGDNRPIEFLIKDMKIKTQIDPERGVDEVLSKIESPSPSVEWTVLDPRSKRECAREMNVLFFAQSRDISSDPCMINVLEKPSNTLILELHIDPETVEAQDDSYTLYTEDGSYSVTKTAQDDIKENDTYLTLLFTKIDPALNYSLSIDPGDDGEPYYYFENLLGEQLLEPEKEITRNTN